MSAAANLLRRRRRCCPPGHRPGWPAAPAGGGADGDRRVPLGVCSSTRPPSWPTAIPRLEADLVLTRLLVRHHVEENLERWRDEVAREAERLIPVLQEQRADAELAKAWRLLGFVHGSVCRYGDAAAAVKQAAKHAARANDGGSRRGTCPATPLRRVFGPTPAEEAIEYCEHLISRRPERPAGRGAGAVLARAAAGDAGRLRACPRVGPAPPAPCWTIWASSCSPRPRRSTALGGAARRRPGTAERELRQAEETLTALGERYLLPPLAAVLAQVVYAQGRADEAEQITRRVEELPTPTTWSRRPSGDPYGPRCWPAGTSPTKPSNSPETPSG